MIDSTMKRRRWRSIGRFVIGIALLVAAGWLIWSRRSELGEALAAARRPSPWHVAGLLACVVANVALTGAYLRVLLARFGRVGMMEMQAIIAAASLLNYLPMRPGMFGRMAYHRSAHGIAVRDTTRTIVEAAVLSATIALYLAVVAVVSMRLDAPLWIGVAVPVGPLIVMAVARPRWFWARAALLRYVEVMVWAVRYVIAFAIIGAPLPVPAALAFACVSVIVTMVPIVGNGLGLREWAIGVLAPLLTAHRLELGVTAELVNRGAELLVIGGLGVAAISWLAGKGAPPTATPDERPDQSS